MVHLWGDRRNSPNFQIKSRGLTTVPISSFDHTTHSGTIVGFPDENLLTRVYSEGTKGSVGFGLYYFGDRLPKNQVREESVLTFDS